MKWIHTTNDYATSPVPTEATYTWWSIALVLVGVGVALPAFFLGDIIAKSLPLSEAIIAIYGGGLIYTAIALGMALVGFKSKLSTYVIANQVFGRYGAYVVSGLIALILTFWFAFNLEVFAATLHTIISSLPIWLATILGGGVMISTAFIGFTALRKLSLLSVPLLLIVLAVGLVTAVSEKSLAVVTEPAPLPLFISIVAGTFMLGAVIMPDIARYARTKTDAVVGTVVGFLIAGPTILLAMTVLSSLTQAPDFISAFAGLGLGAFGLFTLIFAAWTTNDNNLYSASLALSAVMTRTPKHWLVVAAGIIATVVALFGVLTSFVPFVLLLSLTTTPLTGILMVAILLTNTTSRTPQLDYGAIAAWAAGIVVALATTAPDALGFGWFTFTTVPAVDSMLTAALVYFLSTRLN